ncbi:MAG TPA: major facilitator superfamily domain-containing protein 6 [Anaerolineales bacterium]|jgi:PPP family 3-phenylpropionic acid transporter|nr:major facilitator superfamily domain-containing protein 6 [Anaerolineales bacterium]
MKKTWPFTFYVVYFAALSSLMPYLVLFYQARSFSGAQIGLLTGIPPLVTLVAAPFWTGLADSKHWHKRIMGIGILVAVLVSFLLPSISGFLFVFALIILYNTFISPVASLADSATMNMLGEERAMYGRIRLGGTIGWGVFAPIAGILVQRYGLHAAFWSFSVLMLVNLLISPRFVHRSHEQVDSNQGGIRTLLTNRRWINFLFLAFLGGMGSFSVAAYLFPYMAELGANESTMGIASSIATMTELVVFFFGNRLVKKFGSHGLLTLALVMSGLRSVLYSLVSTPAMVLVLQAFGGTIFPALWLAGVSYADEHAPLRLKSSAQGLFGAMTFGVGSATAGFLGGLLLENIGGRGMFLLLGIIVLVGLVLAEGIRRIFPEKDELAPVVTVPSDK